MPELAEVEFFRQRWDPGLGRKITAVELHPSARNFRGCNTHLLIEHLTDTRVLSSEAAAKQMLFRFSGDCWLGIHLGMTGELTSQPPDFAPRKHDHLVLRQTGQSLVFSDHRMFGRVQFHLGPSVPAWWASIAPAILSDAFTIAAVSDFLKRRARSPIKSVLLAQERFPGIGNWMADEILWRAAIHPKQPAGTISADLVKIFHKECRWVCKHALAIIGRAGPELRDPPASWLFPHRWADGGRCPRTGARLVREDVGGRTTCWSPARQFLQTSAARHQRS